LLLKGEWKGIKVKVLEIHISEYNCDVEMVDEEEGLTDLDECDDKDSNILKGIEYEDLSKLSSLA
jgi:hypothetical protein